MNLSQRVILPAVHAACALLFGLLGAACAASTHEASHTATRADAGAADTDTPQPEQRERVGAAQRSAGADGGGPGEPPADRGSASSGPEHADAGSGTGTAAPPGAAGAGASGADTGTHTADNTNNTNDTDDRDAGAAPDAPASQPLCASCGGCEEVQTVVSTMHTTGPISYPDPPPTSGPHNPCWARWGSYDEAAPSPPERWVHNLEHGGVVFLHNCPDGCAADVAKLQALAQARMRTIVTPYAALPARFAVVSWGHRLITDCVDEEAFARFYDANFDHASESIASDPNPGCPP